MPWESDEEKTSPGRDWAKYMWYGVALLMALGVVAAFIPWQKRSIDTTRARVSHLLIKFEGKDDASKQAAVEKLKALRQRILDGESFSELASKYSESSYSAAKGGDLGWVQRGELEKDMDSYIWTAPLNQVSDVFFSEFGVELAIVREREVSKADQYEAELKERVLKGRGEAGAPKP